MDTLNLDHKSKAELAEILSRETLNNARTPLSNGVTQEIQNSNASMAGIFLIIFRNKHRFKGKA